jgi:hypothetical protein
MTDQKLIDAYYQLGRLATEALEEEKYRDAFQYAISAYVIVPESEQHMVDNILVLIWKICEGFVSLKSGDAVERARNRRKEKDSCSFCGKKEPQVKLAQGPDWVFICNSCVTGLYNGFKEGK